MNKNDKDRIIKEWALSLIGIVIGIPLGWWLLLIWLSRSACK